MIQMITQFAYHRNRFNVCVRLPNLPITATAPLCVWHGVFIRCRSRVSRSRAHAWQNHGIAASNEIASLPGSQVRAVHSQYLAAIVP